ncbi:MAG TPA: chemotaxis protein CheW [Lacipirellulaceae bacterium]|nr:chemotaxis protein CheW [Lacipirellulaceae bacterium]
MGAGIPSPSRGRYLIFHLAERAYAISIRDVTEVLAAAELTAVPGSPAFISGFLSVGKQLIAVVSLRRLFGMPDRERELFSPMILVRASDRPLALEVDSVFRIAEVEDAELVAVDDGSSLNNAALSVIRIDGNKVVLLSASRLLLEQERRRVAEMTELARQRCAEAEGVMQ